MGEGIFLNIYIYNLTSIFFFNAALYFLRTISTVSQSALNLTLECIISGDCLTLFIVFYCVPLLLLS